ncbi:hypothetical protein POW71_17995, partial [Klebsiella pneumoniae]
TRAEHDVRLNFAAGADSRHFACPAFFEKPGMRVAVGRHPVGGGGGAVAFQDIQLPPPLDKALHDLS